MSQNHGAQSQTPVRYELMDGYAVITLDDGRVNAFSPAMITAIWVAFDRARDDGVGVLVK